MIPYADFLYFGVLLYVVVPTVILALAGPALRRWILLVTVAMLVVQYGGLGIDPEANIREIGVVALFALFEWAVTLGFLRVRSRGRRRWTFYSALVLALMPLILVRHLPFVAPHFQIGMLGISYVTFRSLDVIFCIQDGLITSLPHFQFLAYVFFFATISAGPIDRYRRFEADWKRRRTRAEFLQDLDGAVHRVFRGFLYKFVLAALVKQYWLDPVAAESGFLSTLAYMYAYSFYLFFDFAGYCAFAIGVSYLFGIHTPENFDRPFLAPNIREFWNRWHITLSWWLRDHVYMRFVMAAKKGGWFKSRELPSYLGIFLTFGLMGLWHGTALNYLIYGMYHGVLRAAHEVFGRWDKRRQLWGDGPLWHAAGVFGTFNLVCFGFLLFSGHLTRGEGANRGAVDGETHVYEGEYEKASCDEIGGWVWDATNPQAPLSVDIVADGRLLATVRADLFRPDLADAGKGHGAHAFLYVVPNTLKDERPHSIAAKISGTDTELSGSPKSLVCVMSVHAMDGYAGAHDTTECDLISGWAWDATRPDHPVGVEIYEGRMLLATVTADRFRESLRDAGYGNGAHGFLWLTPAHLRDGQPHTLSVRIAGTNITLRNTPQVVQCSETTVHAPGSRAASSSSAAMAKDNAKRPLPTPAFWVDNRDGTISDRNTGLMWEKKVKLDGVVDAANLHDGDNCYPWAGGCAKGGAECRLDADCGQNGPCTAHDCQASGADGLTIFKWVGRLNATRFAGHDDWRMPSSAELYTIETPFVERDPATIAAFRGASCGSDCGDLTDPACSCINDGLYWAAANRAAGPDQSWMTLFYCREKMFLDLRSSKFHVRAVRGGPS